MSGTTDPSQHLFWLASRALGVVALVVISLSVGLGLSMSARLVRLPGAPVRLKHIHEALSLTGLIAIAGHGLLLLGDRYLHPGLAGIALPFALAGQTVWTGVGIIAGWLAAIVGLSFYVRRLIGTQVWRWLHRWTLAVYLMSVAHAIGSGTDGRSAWLLALIGLTAAPALFAGVYRFLPRERRPLPSGRESVIRHGRPRNRTDGRAPPRGYLEFAMATTTSGPDSRVPRTGTGRGGQHLPWRIPIRRRAAAAARGVGSAVAAVDGRQRALVGVPLRRAHREEKP